MTALDLSKEGTAELLAFTENLARKAGTMIRTAFHSQAGDYDRKSATDPVTETDRAVEAMLFGGIRAKYPAHSFIGEESASNCEWTSSPTWIVDPIDGTANFVHKIPVCAVSIGFTVDRKFIVGVIYNPILDELFSASHLTASTLNGTEIKVSQVSELTSACVATECGSDRAEAKVDFVLEQLSTVLRNRAQCVRMLGSCALNMAHVACGRADVYYEHGPYAWDMAAGVLIIRQAGGVVCGAENGVDTPFDLTARSVLAFTPGLASELGRTCLGRRVE